MKHPVLAFGLIWCLAAHGAECVIGISIDGLGANHFQDAIDRGEAPHLKRFQDEGSGTIDARTDYFMTITLPNHTSMLTGRPVNGSDGHGWTDNTDPTNHATLHRHKGAYVASVFDVAHDSGLRTGLWSTKTKFSLFADSFNAENGALDTNGTDQGRNKIDVFKHRTSCTNLADDFIATMRSSPCQFAFVHFGDTDVAGHAKGWGGPEYRAALKSIDACVGRIMELIRTDGRYKDKTVLVLTSDHGGRDKGHSDAKLPANHTIPFFVWGAGVKKTDLYEINSGCRFPPKNTRPSFQDAEQPIRNGDLGNLALSELGLGPIPGSRINARQDLRIRAANP